MSRAISRYAVAIPLLVAAAVYLPSLRGEFVWDDTIYLHRWLTSGSSLREIFLPSTRLAGGVPFYKPVAGASQYLLFSMFGTWAPGWRLGGLLLHMLTVAGVYSLVRRWWAGGERPERGALVAATLFACWPATAEALGWISARSETLMGALLVFALVLHLDARDRGRSALPAAGLFFLALLSKETALAFIGVVVAATWLLPPSRDAARSDPGARFAASLWLPYVLAYLGYTALRRIVLGSKGSIASVAADRIGMDTVEPAFRAWGYYVREALLLGPGAPYLEYPPDTIDVRVFAVFGLAVGVASLVAVRREGTRPLTFAALWFTAFLVPALAVVAGSVSITAVAIRYLYVPLIGLAAAAGWAVSRMPDRWFPMPVRAAGFAAIVLLGWMTQGRIAPWMNGRALWERAYADVPRSTMTASNLAAQIRRSDPQRSEDLLRIAVYLGEPKDETHTHKLLVRLANLYSETGRYREARRTLLHAANFPADDENLAAARRAAWVLELLERSNRSGSAAMPLADLLENAARLERAAELDPLDRETPVLLGGLYESVGELVRARSCYRRLVPLTLAAPDIRRAAEEKIAELDARIRAEPDPLRKRYFEAQECEHEKDLPCAVRAYEAALVLAPDRVELLLALADVRSARDENADARRLLERASVLAPEDAAVWVNLGLTCGALEDFRCAADAFTRAAELRPGWAKPRLHQGRALERLGDPARALDAYVAFLARYPEEDGTRHAVEMRAQALRAELARTRLAPQKGTASDENGPRLDGGRERR